jgi:hypothetical protein
VLREAACFFQVAPELVLWTEFRDICGSEYSTRSLKFVCILKRK